MDTVLQQLTRGHALLLVAVLGFGGIFHTGYHITALSSPSPFIQDFINSSWRQRHGEAPSPEMVTILWSLVVSLYAFGGLCGAASISHVAGFLGRKKGVICSSCIAVVAAVLMLTSQTASSYEMVMVARTLFGFAAGLGGSLHLMYLTEISPKNIRGIVTLTSTIFLSLGELSGQLFGLSELLGREDLWTVALALPACLSLVQILVFPFFPESPRYLFIEKGDEEACRRALTHLWGPGDYKQEMSEMLTEQKAIEAAPPKGPLQLLRDGTVRWQLLTMILIYWFNQLSGMSAISIFSFDVFTSSGVPEDQIRYVTLGLGVCDIITSLSSSLLIERVGRRPLFWGGYGAMFSLWVLFTVMLNLKDPPPWVSYINTVTVILVIVFFSGGPGPAAVTLNSEIFVQSDRLAAFAIVGPLRWLAQGVMGFLFPFLISSLGSYSFVLFACVCLLACLFTFFLLPETKGRTMLEISEDFKAISLCRKCSPWGTVTETKL